MTTLPGTSAASVSRLMSSSEPLPSMMSQPAGMEACLASSARSTSPRSAGIAVQRDLGQALAQRLAQRRRGRRNGFSIVSTFTKPALGWTA